MFEVQDSVDEPPEVTLVGVANRFTVGFGGGDTVTVTAVEAVPPAPVQSRS